MGKRAVVLVVLLAAAGAAASLAVLGSQGYDGIPDRQRDLDEYRKELEKIGQSNQRMLQDLEQEIQNADGPHLEQLRKEIDVMRGVVEENGKELERVVTRLSEVGDRP